VRRNFLVGLAGAKQHTIGHDHGRSAAWFEQLQEQGHKQQLGFPGVHHPLQLGADALGVERSGEGRIGQDQGVFIFLDGAIL
jgi:hypothetical protein